MPYSTKQQQAGLHCLESRREEALTAAELAEDLRKSGSPVGLATIYRQLEKLAAAGRVHKINTEDGAFYQYCGHEAHDHRDCFLLQCEGCGRIYHLDCSKLQGLYEHLAREHHFQINPRRTLFSGLCDTCLKKEAAEHGKS